METRAHHFVWKKIMQPRLTAWMEDLNKPYSYSGITMQPQGWSKALLTIKKRIELVANVTLNGALLNFYRSESDSMGWHQDNEKELGSNPVVGSVSFGAIRNFQLRHVKEKNLKQTIHLSDGSFLLMQGETQTYWHHCIPK